MILQHHHWQITTSQRRIKPSHYYLNPSIASIIQQDYLSIGGSRVKMITQKTIQQPIQSKAPFLVDLGPKGPNLENKHFLGLLGSVILLQMLLWITVPKMNKILRAVLDLQRWHTNGRTNCNVPRDELTFRSFREGTDWNRWVLFGTVWNNLKLFRTVWYCLEQFRTVWYCLVLLGTV